MIKLTKPLNLLIDRRWNGNHGIGRYSRELVAKILQPNVEFLDSGNPLSLIQMGTSSFKAFKYNAFYSPGFVPMLGHAKQLITIHDLILLRSEIADRTKTNFFNRLLLPLIRDGAVKIVSVSKSSQLEIANWAGIQREEIEIVSNGLSKAFIEFGNKLPSNIERKSLIFVGNMKKHKNFQLFADAVNLLPGSWRIRLVGPNLNHNLINVRHKVSNYWNISDSELASLYNKSEILVNTSSYEGFGMPLLEGGYLGCKIVHLGVLPTIQEILGEDSFHTDGSNSPNLLADLLFYVNELEQIREVRKGLLDEYSWEKSGKRLSQLISSFEKD